MRILIINSVAGVGSTGKICVDLYDELTKKGNECLIGFGRGQIPKGYKCLKIGTNISLISHIISTRLFDNHGQSSRIATYFFLKQVKKFNPDVIHLHNIHGYYINYKMLFRYVKKNKIKVVWTLHDSWAISGHTATYDLFSGDKKFNFGKQMYPKTFFKTRWKKNIRDKKKYFSNVENMRIVTPSYWLANMIKESFLKDYPIEVIHNGIVLNSYEEVAVKKEFSNKILGVSNIWTKEKGIQVFNELAEELDDSLEITLIGKKGDIAFNKKINHISYISNKKELLEIYKSCYCFVNPTYFDNFPTVNIEALSMGLPVITFDVGGAGEMLTDRTGFKISEKKVSNIIEKINEIQIIKRNDCVVQSKKFSHQEMVNSYITLFEQKGVIKSDE